MNIIAPIPIFLATSSLFSRFGFFSSISDFAFSTASLNKSSNNTTSPFLVDNFLSANLTVPKGM